MSNILNDVKEVYRTSDIKEVNNMLKSGNYILLNTQCTVPELSIPNDVTVLFILGRIK